MFANRPIKGFQRSMPAGTEAETKACLRAPTFKPTTSRTVDAHHVSIDGKNRKLRVRFDIDGTVCPVDVSTVATVLESPSSLRYHSANAEARRQHAKRRTDLR